MRASDDDRETVAGRLRDAHAEGRLTIEEFEERLDATYAAKTVGELVVVTRDLPRQVGAAQLPTRQEPAGPTSVVAHGRNWNRGVSWGAWASAVSVNVAVWASIGIGSGHFPYFWPIWVAGPWAALLLARTFSGAERERPGRRDGERDHL
jgi:Domain of unknown function (DUF1707).